MNTSICIFNHTLNVDYLEQLVEDPLKEPIFYDLLERIKLLLEQAEIKQDPYITRLLEDYLWIDVNSEDPTAFLTGTYLDYYKLLSSLTDRGDGLCYHTRNALLEYIPDPEEQFPLSYLFPKACLSPFWARFFGIKTKEISCTREQKDRITSILAKEYMMIQMPEDLSLKKLSQQLSTRAASSFLPRIEILDPSLAHRSITKGFIMSHAFEIAKHTVALGCNALASFFDSSSTIYLATGHVDSHDIEQIARKCFGELSLLQKDQVYGKIWELAKMHDCRIGGEKWGEINAQENFPRLAQALHRLGFLNHRTDLRREVSCLSAHMGEGGLGSQYFSLGEKLGNDPAIGPISCVNGMGVPTLEHAGQDAEALSRNLVRGFNIHCVYNATHVTV